MTLKDRFGASNIKISSKQGFANWTVHEPNTVTIDEVVDALKNANYTPTRVELEVPGKPIEARDF